MKYLKLISLLLICVFFVTNSYADNTFNKTYAISEAENGKENFQFYVGDSYLHGKNNFIKDYNLANKWLKKAAEQQYPEALYTLGLMYMKGDGVSKNSKESFKWFLKAANLSHQNAQYYLAVFYIRGIGVNTDFIKSYAWLKVSKENKQQAQRLHADLLKEMSEDDLVKAQEAVKKLEQRLK